MIKERKPDGWVARDSEGGLRIYRHLPIRHICANGKDGVWYVRNGGQSEGGNLFLKKDHSIGHKLTWDDEPRPVFLNLYSPVQINALVEAATNLIKKDVICNTGVLIETALQQALEPFTEEKWGLK
jgi:hypothetical protein